MNKTYAILALSCALALSMAAPLSEAAVIDQVKSKVDAIKTETATIKNKTSNIQARISDVSSVVNEQVGELDQVKAALDSLQAMKDKFAGGGFDPADLLEMIDTDELQAKLDEIREHKQEWQAMVNDPDLEYFRADLLHVLAGIRELVTPVEQNDLVDAAGQYVEFFPFQGLVENAPRPVIAVLKKALGSNLQKLQNNVESANGSKQWLVDNGVLPIDRARVCDATTYFGKSAILLALWDHERKIKDVQAKWNRFAAKAKQSAEKSEWVMPDIGIHGYFAISLPKSFVAESMADINSQTGGFDWHIRKTNQLKELVGWISDNTDICTVNVPFVD